MPRINVVTVQWWAKFAVRSDMSEGLIRTLEESEDEPLSTMIDVTDICASNRMSAELWYEPRSADTRRWSGDRVYVGWIDELGRLHSRRDSQEAAARLADVIGAEGGIEQEWMTRELPIVSRVHPSECARQATGVELWASTKRASGRVHRFCEGEVRIG